MNYLNPQQIFTNQLAKNLACLEALNLQNRQTVSSAFEKDISTILKQLNTALVGETENDITSLRSFAKIIRDFLASIPKSVYGGCKTGNGDYLVMFIIPSYIDPIDHEDIKMVAHIYQITDGKVDMQQRVATYTGENINVSHIMDVSKYKSGDTIDLTSVNSCITFGDGSSNTLSLDDPNSGYENFQLKIEGQIIISSPFNIKFNFTTLEYEENEETAESPSH